MTSRPRIPKSRGSMKVAGAMTGRITHHDLGNGWKLAFSKSNDGHEVMMFSAPDESVTVLPDASVKKLREILDPGYLV